MNRGLITGGLITALVALVCVSLTGTAFSQTPMYDPSARAMYKALPPHNYYPNQKPADPAVQLPQWTLSWLSSHNGHTYTSVFLGTDPQTSNATTTITVGIIPIKMVYGASNGNMTFDPNTTGQFDGKYSTTQMVNDSVIFQSIVDYNQGGTDLGKTQYEDAYMRGNFWGSIQTNNKWHLMLKTVIGPEQTFTVPSSEGDVISNPWSGIPTGTADINWFDAQLQAVMAKYSCAVIKEPCIGANVLPLFITENVYLTEGGCCIGGYHSANGPAPSGQTYSYSTSIQQASIPVFSQDVGALAHEVGEWIMDPFTENASPCINDNTILEVGDPLELDATFGDYPYTVQGFTFHPQDLVFLSWFGSPQSLTLSEWNGKPANVVTFQNENLTVCQVN
jgi:hypothetical protein